MRSFVCLQNPDVIMLQLHKGLDGSLTSGIYKSNDSICNLRLKVRLEKETREKRIERSVIEESPQHDIELQNISRNEVEKETEEKIIGWQEKIFNVDEINKYSNVSNCKTSLEIKYNEEVTKLIASSGAPRNRIFTYVDVDNCINKNEENETCTFLEDRMNNLRLRNVTRNDVIPKSNIVDQFPTRAACEVRHVQQSSAKVMQIMGDLNQEDKLGVCSGVVLLCKIEAFSDGTIIITPDLNNSNQPYFLQNKERVVFRYFLEDASLKINQEDLNKEKNRIKQLYNQQLELTQRTVGSDFEIPTPDVLRVFLMGEIVSAKNFGWTNLYINYIVELPSYWTSANDNQELFGTTLTASTKVENRDEVAYFSCPCDIELILNINQVPKDEPVKFPQLLLEVWSQDFWNRYRIQGYGYVTIPFKPGVYNWEIETWKPINNSHSGLLREFFLGYSSELDGLTFPSRAAILEKEHPLSRLGLKTESSGSVSVKMNIIHQSLNFLQSDECGKSLRNLLSQLGRVTFQTTILKVLEAFQRARHRMLRARENIQTTLPSTTTEIKSTLPAKTTEIQSSSLSRTKKTQAPSSDHTSTRPLPSSSLIHVPISSSSKTTSTLTTEMTTNESTTSSSSSNLASPTTSNLMTVKDTTSTSFLSDTTELTTATCISSTSKRTRSSAASKQRIVPAIIHDIPESSSETEESEISDRKSSKNEDTTTLLTQSFSPFDEISESETSSFTTDKTFSKTETDKSSREYKKSESQTSSLSTDKTVSKTETDKSSREYRKSQFSISRMSESTDKSSQEYKKSQSTSLTADESAISSKSGSKGELQVPQNEARIRRRKKKEIRLPAISEGQGLAAKTAIDQKMPMPYSDSTLQRKTARRKYEEFTKPKEFTKSATDSEG